MEVAIKQFMKDGGLTEWDYPDVKDTFSRVFKAMRKEFES